MDAQKFDFLLSDLYYIAREKSNRDWMLIARTALAKAGALSDAAQAPTIEVPERVIDKLFQAAGVSTCGPDGEDILDKLHAFARNVVAETLARLPAAPVAPAAATPSDSPALLPCRICGSAATPAQTVSGHGDRWFTCVNCREETPRLKSQLQCVLAWNARTPNPEYTRGWQDCLSMHIAPGQPTPVYQIGSPVAGGIAWWDVTQERYEAEKKAGYMKTCIVYREP